MKRTKTPEFHKAEFSRAHSSSVQIRIISADPAEESPLSAFEQFIAPGSFAILRKFTDSPAMKSSGYQAETTDYPRAATQGASAEHLKTPTTPEVRPEPSAQLELGIEREEQPDRNHQEGGRSFYFFDLDDNVFYLPTSIYAFHKATQEEVELNTGDYALYSPDIGKRGRFKDYELNFNDDVGSYRRFRDQHEIHLSKQAFLEDLAQAMKHSDLNWKGPSWHTFYHAAFNQRPISVITARGHSPETVKAGIHALVESGFLPLDPNYLTVFPVSHPETRKALGDSESTWSIAKLKRAAIKFSVRQAMSKYGASPHHRFGMSDDSPENLRLIETAMVELKREFPHNSFYVIDTEGARYVKREVFSDHVTRTSFDSMDTLVKQLDLFTDL